MKPTLNSMPCFGGIGIKRSLCPKPIWKSSAKLTKASGQYPNGKSLVKTAPLRDGGAKTGGSTPIENWAYLGKKTAFSME